MSEPAKCVEESKRIGFEIRHLSNCVKKTIDAVSADSEVTGVQSFLLGFLVIESTKRDVYQRDVEKFLHISKASVTSLLQQMEKRGCIRRESVEGDARLKRIVVTEKGARIHYAVIDNLDRMEFSMQKNIPEEDLQCFFRVMAQIESNLKDTYNILIESKE